ncbi:MAG TPA: hypothetical protein VGM51_15190 [Armatimonadota bacterium]|jgi:hypothetical protein
MNPIHLAGLLSFACLMSVAAVGSSRAARPEGFDIFPFSLPRCPDGEVRFEEPRDIARVVVTFEGDAPDQVSLSYMHKVWPETRIETGYQGVDNAMSMGWYPIEDWFNCDWRKAETNIERPDAKTVVLTFKGLASEFPDVTGYDVAFRRTQGFRIQADPQAKIESLRVYTASQPATSTIRVAFLDGSKHKAIRVSGYNAVVERVKAESGAKVRRGEVIPDEAGKGSFTVQVSHMAPAHRFCGDDGHVTFSWDGDAFTVSLTALEQQGPVWFEDEGIFITRADDPTTLDEYRKRYAGAMTTAQKVLSLPEQSLGGALNGQPRPHPDSFVVGCKNARQRFRIEANGDIHLAKGPMDWVRMSDSPRFKNTGDARFFFGLERYRVVSRAPDPAPIMAYNTHLISDDIDVDQKAFAVPLFKKMADDTLVGDDSIAGIVQFTFRNTSAHTAYARLPIGYSSESRSSGDRMGEGSQYGTESDGNRVPRSARDKVGIETLAGSPSLRTVTTPWKDEKVVRCVLDSAMRAEQSGDSIVLRQELKPGETCTATLRIPYVSPNDAELKALAALGTAAAYTQVRDFWRAVGETGAQIHTPEPRLDALYKAHFAYVSVADFAMPNAPDLINTSVGTSIYPNYTNESCMIVDELETRGLHEEARRRLATWIRYQGTAPVLGNFSDHDGVLYGAGGFECGNTYDQHHGWALWRIAEHFLQTRDEAWLKVNAGALVKGADWVFRQRRLTMKDLPHSRGWEYGFLPAGSLEDVSDYFYWLSTNAVTWRGVDSAAKALEVTGHPDAARIRKEADAYKADLIKGFETSRQYTPLVKLPDGRWVPDYPSRLYLRGRDTGWIREVLEGSVYLLITGLYPPEGKQAQWILDDYQDNRYLGHDFGYPVFSPERLWYDVGGFSCQPNLLAGLMPYLDRDETEIYIWMFFNAWAACYREEANSMVEHPSPILGHSNQAIVKTSDEANAVKWLTYMFVYAPGDTLYLGRAIPREWLSDGRVISAQRLNTRFGEVSVRYLSNAASGTISLAADLAMENKPGSIIVRIRHPEKKPIKSVTVNGAPHAVLDPVRGDVDITGMSGKVIVEAAY